MIPITPPRSPRARACWALGLAGAILALTVGVGPQTIAHHHGTAKEFHACALHHWTHDAGSSAPCHVGQEPALDTTASAEPQPVRGAPSLLTQPTASRAPPAIA